MYNDWPLHLIYSLIIGVVFVSRKIWKERAEKLVVECDYRWESICHQLNYKKPRVIVHSEFKPTDETVFILRGNLHENGRQEVVCEIYSKCFDEKNLHLQIAIDVDGKLWPTNEGPSYLPPWKNI